MAMTPAESQRAYRERIKARKEAANLAAYQVFNTPFYEALPEDHSYSSDFANAFELMGIPTPEFSDDRGPEEFTLDVGAKDDGFFDKMPGSLGRAELMVDCLLAAAKDLASHVSDHKKSEIKARLAEIETSDLSDPEIRKAALKDVTRLNKMLDQLDKQVRWTFPQWKVTG
ncbi:hypothetical protein [Paracoccus methylarcula]|uniref:Uncharacterized protein n=1 Tax=Paracoccus methylarcula TaxID=72022 RepID=A0A3R7PP47_9RHOB|nr:hypothetical protein [Paracoccus methylarcula]RNF33984.1 hypothetical protein A7A09_013855 [Paracoccus methylarcula]